MSLIYNCNKSLTPELCETIIDKFNEESISNIFNIPKNNISWQRIERIIYKELLIGINEYKSRLIDDINLNNELILLLNKTLYIKNLTIQKINIHEDNNINYNLIPNRYNVLTYIFYLNNTTGDSNELNNSNNIQGNLIIFPENICYPYKCNLSKNEQYIISGQLYYDNII